MKLKLTLIKLLMRNWDFFLVARSGENGCVVYNQDEESEAHIRAILHSAFESGEEDIKRLVLGATEDWLKERVVETKDFIERIK